MRIAFISDIHGNFTALEAVQADIRKVGVDQIVCLGDTATLGPHPLEVLNALRDMKSINIRGNHDAAMLDPKKAGEFEITEYLVPDLYWGRERLSPADFEFIRSFVPAHEIIFPNGVKLLAYHGSPHSVTELILATTSNEKMDELFNKQTASVFIGGHSHIQMHRRYGDRLVLNSGSVGNAFVHAYTPGVPPSLLPWAEYAIVEQSGELLDVDLRRVYFDTETLLKIIRESSLPGKDWWLRQYKDK